MRGLLCAVVVLGLVGRSGAVSAQEATGAGGRTTPPTVASEAGSEFVVVMPKAAAPGGLPQNAVPRGATPPGAVAPGAVAPGARPSSGVLPPEAVDPPLALFGGAPGSAEAGAPATIAAVPELTRWFAERCRDLILEAAEVQATIRLSLRADGSLFGGPVVMRAVVPKGKRVEATVLRDRAMATLKQCLPAPLTPAFGASMAGRQLLHQIGRAPAALRPGGKPGGRDIAI